MIALLCITISFTFWRGYKLFSLISRTEKAKKWDVVKAIVMDARILDKQKSAESRIKDFKTCFFYAVYEYNGIKFGTTTINLYQKNVKSDSLAIKKIHDKKEIDIFVNPEKPHESVLLHPSSHGIMKDWFLMMAGFGFSLLVFYYMVK